MYIDSIKAMQTPKEYWFQTLHGIFEQLENTPFYRKMSVFIDNAQHVDTGIEEVRTLLDKADIAKHWIPIIQRGQELQYFHAGNPHAMCVALFGAVQGIAQEKVRMPDTPLPDAKWLMRLVEEETET